MADGFDPPWRFDPLQNAVDVNWGDNSIVVGYYGSNSVRLHEPDGTLRWASSGPAGMWEVCRDGEGYAYSYGQLLYNVPAPPPEEQPFNWNVLDPTYLWKFHKDTGTVMWRTQVTATPYTFIFDGESQFSVHRLGFEGGLAADPEGNIFISHLDIDPASTGGPPENLISQWLIKKYSPSGRLIQTKRASASDDNPGPLKRDWGYFCDGDGNLCGGYLDTSGIFKRHESSLNLMWEYDSGDNNCIPVVDGSNNVYFMGGGVLYKLSPGGVLQWAAELGDDPFVSYHQIGTDGVNVYAFTAGEVHKVEPKKGEILWTMEAGNIDWSAGAYCAADYFGGPLYKFNSGTGVLEWTAMHLGIDGGGPFTIGQVPIFGKTK